MDITEMVDDGTVRALSAAELGPWMAMVDEWMSGWVMINAVAIVFSNQRCYFLLGIREHPLKARSKKNYDLLTKDQVALYHNVLCPFSWEHSRLKTYIKLLADVMGPPSGQRERAKDELVQFPVRGNLFKSMLTTPRTAKGCESFRESNVFMGDVLLKLIDYAAKHVLLFARPLFPIRLIGTFSRKGRERVFPPHGT